MQAKTTAGEPGFDKCLSGTKVYQKPKTKPKTESKCLLLPYPELNKLQPKLLETCQISRAKETVNKASIQGVSSPQMAKFGGKWVLNGFVLSQ